MKIVVFDLDETLGYFTQYGIFWDSLVHYFKNMNKTLVQSDFNDILDLYPEVLRPNIINILQYLKEKKTSKCCNKMFIYTNNNGPREWAQHIIKYFEGKINYKLVDQVISAFKVNGKTFEVCRTTCNKTHDDLIRCTRIPASAEVCFLDDTFYPEMANDNIYYINIKPYYYDLNFDYIIKKFKESPVGQRTIGTMNAEFEKKIMAIINRYKYKCFEKDPKEYEIDKILGKQIIIHLQDFFSKKKKNATIKNRAQFSNAKNNKSRKNNNI